MTTATRRGTGSAGQSTVELALGLPVLVAGLLFLMQVGLVVRDQVLVVHAARTAARAAAVEPGSPAPTLAVVRASPGLDPDRLRVSVVRRGAVGDLVEVRVSYTSLTDVVLIGPLLGAFELEATAAMQVEQ